MSGPLFFELSTCIVATVCEMLALDQPKFDGNVFVSINCLIIHVSMFYVLCHYSEKLTTQSSAVANLIYSDLLWYELTIERQKGLILPMCCSQKTFRLTGYGIFDCSMEMFWKVN